MEYLQFFIYGPMQKGGNEDGALPEGSIFVRNAILPYKLYQSPYGNPALSSEQGRCKGEMYKIPKESISELDRLFGFISHGNADNLNDRKMLMMGGYDLYIYFASSEQLKAAKEYDMVIEDGDWTKFYNEVWKSFDSNGAVNVSANFTEDDLFEVCVEAGVDSIDELNTLLESYYRKSIMLEAEDKKKKPNLDDLNEPEEELQPQIDVIDNGKITQDVAPEPSLDDLTEPDEELPPEPVKAPEKPVKPTAKQPKAPKVPPPQAPVIPSKKELPPEEKIEEPVVANDWKKEKHLRTLYNNFNKIFPKRGTSKKSTITFSAVHADPLHPDSKYLQANITSVCKSEDLEKNNYYNQWIQLRRQRNTQTWSVDLPCEVRCNCKAFIYNLAYANIKNKSFAGAAVKKGRLDGYPINYTLPSNEKNPAYVPALCKHLQGLTNELFNMDGDGKVNKKWIL